MARSGEGGSLGGHIVPAVFFLIYGIWWIIATFWLYLSQKYNLKIKQRGFFDIENISKKSYIPLCLLPLWPIEPVLKIIFPSMGIIMEAFFRVRPNDTEHDQHYETGVWSMYNSDGSFAMLVKLHHITMHLCFIVSGIVDLLSLCSRYPKHTSKLFLALAFFVETFLFYFHIQGDKDRSQLEVLMHELLIFSIGVCVVFAALRMVKSSNILINGGLALGITLQGTWLIEIGVVIFGPVKWKDVHNNYMFIVACFVWHCMSIIVGMFILLTAMEYGVQRYTKKKQVYQLLDKDSEQTLT